MRKYFLIPVLMLAALVACTKPEEQGKEPSRPDQPEQPTTEATVTLLSESSVAVPVEGDIVTIKFKATADWTAASDAQWLTLSTDKGSAADECTVKASAVKNEATDVRTAKVTITCGKATAEVVVTQGQVNDLNIDVTEYTVPAEGGEVEVTVSANVDYEVIIPEAIDWVTVEKTKGMVDTKLVFTVNETHEYADEYLDDWSDEHIVRTANITIKADKLSSVISIGQKTFCPYFDYTGDWSGLQWSYYSFNYWGGEPTYIPQEGVDIVIPVETNIPEWKAFFSVWDNDLQKMVETSDVGWARVAYDVENAEIHLVVDENATYFDRDEYLYVECYIDGVLDQNFGALGQMHQYGKPVDGALAEKAWVKSLGELGIPAAYNRLAYKTAGGDALIVSDGEKIHAVSPADGSYYTAITWSNVKPTSICSDDAGNLIVGEHVSARVGETYKVYYATNVKEDPIELFSHTADFDGQEVGGWRVRGDIDKGAIVTGISTAASFYGDNYWVGWEIKNKEISYDNSYVSGSQGQNRGPIIPTGGGDAGSAVYSAVIAVGNNANDGILYRGYDGDRNVFYLASAAYPNWAITYDWKVFAEGGNNSNVNQNNMTVAEYNGKRLLAFTQGFHFSYSYDQGYIVVMDITNPADAKPLITIDADDYLDFNADFLWQSSADVLLHPTSEFLELYVVNSGLGVLAKYNIVVE